jgi:IMP dehydrogenase
MRRLLTFDDVGLIPRFNRISSRLDTNIKTELGRAVYKTPFIPANMDTVIGEELANVCSARGAPVIFHRFAPIHTQLEWLKKFPEAYFSIGVTSDDNTKLSALHAAGCRRFCIDIAHGHSDAMMKRIRELKREDHTLSIIAGNVCTADAVTDLVKAGADIIKVGVGPGAACTTRIMTAFGVPQFSAIRDCSDRAKLDSYNVGRNIHIIADGGIKAPRDAVLAIAAGAEAVMMGSVFARTYESAAEKEIRNGKTYARYRGQASAEFMEEYYGDSKKRTAEGVAFDVLVEKSAHDVFDMYEGGLRSALTYCGVNNLSDFYANAQFFESTPSYMTESGARMI